MDSSTLRTWLAMGIMALAALVVAFLVIWATLQGQPIPTLAISLGSILIGYASHELGVSRGAYITAAATKVGADISPVVGSSGTDAEVTHVAA